MRPSGPQPPTPGRDRARPSPRWWQRTLLFLLSTRPPWWGRAGLWMVLCTAIFYFVALVRGTSLTTGSGWGTTVSQRPSGDWQVGVTGNEVQIVSFSWSLGHESGLGWERWTASTPMVVVTPQVSPAPAPPTPAQLDSLRRMALQRYIDVYRGYDRRLEIPGLELVRDGRTERVDGVMYHLRGWGQNLALAMLVFATIVGTLRLCVRADYRNRLRLAADGQCPACTYPLEGLVDPDRCPECGVNVVAEVAATRHELGEGDQAASPSAPKH